MNDLLEFLSFSDPNVRYVTLGSMLLAASSAVVGSFTFLKKKALVGDAVSHAVLPGICLAFMLAGEKNLFYLIIGAFVTGWLSLIGVDIITRYTKLKQDAAIGLVLSVSFGFGILLLTNIQHSGNAAQSGLDHFLFGNAASLVGSDLWVFAAISLIILLIVIPFYKEFSLISFDEQYAKTIGLPVKFLELLLTTLTVLAVVVGIQAVGVVLMAAMLITPAAAARYWTDRLTIMVILAAVFGAVSGLSGSFISYAAPSMPTGPWIVMVLSALAIGSFFLAPRKGILFKLLTQARVRRQMMDENILKAMYQLGESSKDFLQSLSIDTIIERRRYPRQRLLAGLLRLQRQGFVKRSSGKWSFTQPGLDKGARVVRLHRLWELYLTEYMRIAPDHVHDDADTIEHIITPEIEQRLSEKLNYPKVDPHQSEIPY